MHRFRTLFVLGVITCTLGCSETEESITINSVDWTCRKNYCPDLSEQKCRGMTCRVEYSLENRMAESSDATVIITAYSDSPNTAFGGQVVMRGDYLLVERHASVSLKANQKMNVKDEIWVSRYPDDLTVRLKLSDEP